MSTSPTRVMASVVAVAILAFPAVHALPDPAPVPTAEAPAPSTEAPLSAPSAEKAAPASVTESPAAPPEAEVPRRLLRPKPCHFSKPNSSTSCSPRSRFIRTPCSHKS
jgi:hypothetical protein